MSFIKKIKILFTFSDLIGAGLTGIGLVLVSVANAQPVNEQAFKLPNTLGTRGTNGDTVEIREEREVWDVPIKLISASAIESPYRVQNDTSLLNLYQRWATIARYEMTFTGRDELPWIPELQSIQALTFKEGVDQTLEAYKKYALNLTMLVRIDEEKRHLYLTTDPQVIAAHRAANSPVPTPAAPVAATPRPPVAAATAPVAAPAPAPAQVTLASVAVASLPKPQQSQQSQQSQQLQQPTSPIVGAPPPPVLENLSAAAQQAQPRIVQTMPPTGLQTGYAVLDSDKTLVQMLVRWATQSGYSVTINSQPIVAEVFPRHLVRYSDYSIAELAKSFKSSAPMKDAIGQVLLFYTGKTLTPFLYTVDEATKRLSITSLIN